MKDTVPDAMHPYEDQLPAYLLGELDPETRSDLEAHLATCAACRTTLARLDEAFVASVEALDGPPPPAASWAAIEMRTRANPVEDRAGAIQPRVPRWWFAGWAATVLVAVVLGAWGFQQRAAVIATGDTVAALEARIVVLQAVTSTVQARADGLSTEQARLVRWLARDDVASRRLPVADDGVARGAVLFLPDRRALVTLRTLAPEGETHVVWGVADGVASEPLATFSTRTVEVDASAFEALLVATVPSPASSPNAAAGRVEVPTE